MLEIDDEQDDHRRGKQQSWEQQRLPTQLPVVQQKQQWSDHFNRGIHHRDRLAACSASTTQCHVSQDGKVLEPSQCAPTPRAMRRGRHHRLPPRQAVDADVQKTAQDETDGHQQEDARNLWHHRVGSDNGEARGSAGRGNRGESDKRSTSPELGSSVYGSRLGRRGPRGGDLHG